MDGGCTDCTRRMPCTVHADIEDNPQPRRTDCMGPHGSTNNVAATDVDGRVGSGLGRFGSVVWRVSGRSSMNVVSLFSSRAVETIFVEAIGAADPVSSGENVFSECDI